MTATGRAGIYRRVRGTAIMANQFVGKFVYVSDTSHTYIAVSSHKPCKPGREHSRGGFEKE